MCQFMQVISLERDKKQLVLEKLPRLSLGTSELDQTCRITKKTHQTTIGINFKIIRIKISNIFQEQCSPQRIPTIWVSRGMLT